MEYKVTVLTLVYNGLPYLKESIESILNQSYENFEFLIIDDASPDKNVVKFIESYNDPRIRFVKNDINLGVSLTFNKALTIINTPYVIRSDQDDVSLPNRINDQLKHLVENPEDDIICSWEHTIDSNGKRVRDCKRSLNNYGEFIGPVLLGICPIWHPSIAFRKDSMINAGGFKTEYTRAEDFEVTARLAIKRYEAKILQKFHLLQRQHKESQSQEFSEEMADMSNRIQEEVLAFFLEKDEAKKIAPFLRLQINKNEKNFKSYILRMNRSLNTLFNNLRNKQKMNTEEFESLKKTIFMRIGLGLKFLPFYRFLPSSLFKIIFFCFSPLYLKKIYSSLSSINRLIKF
jgi:glycosyltransferase involved in cell wall biosynthesis